MAIGQHLPISNRGPLELYHSSSTISLFSMSIFFHIISEFNFSGSGNNGFSVKFSSFGCIKQEQQIGKVIRTMSKHQKLFTSGLDLSLLLLWVFQINRRPFGIGVHWCLGHLNNDRLATLFKLGCLEPSINKHMLSYFMKYNVILVKQKPCHAISTSLFLCHNTI